MAKPSKTKPGGKLRSPTCATGPSIVGLLKRKRKTNPLNSIAKSKQLEDKLKSRKRNSSPRLSCAQREFSVTSRLLPLAESENRFSIDDQSNTITSKRRSVSPGMDDELPAYQLETTRNSITLYEDTIEIDLSSPESTYIPEQPKLRPMPSFIDLEKKYTDDDVICENTEQNTVTSPLIASKLHALKTPLRNGESNDTADNVSQPKRMRLSDSLPEHNRYPSVNSVEDAHLLTVNEVEQDKRGRGSPDSNNTVDYDLSLHSPKLNFPRPFSPIPSTSSNNTIFNLNEQKLNDSFKSERVLSNGDSPKPKQENKHDSDDDVEIIEIPCDTIIIDDSLPRNPPIPKPLPSQDNSCIIIDCDDEPPPPNPIVDRAQTTQNRVIDTLDFSIMDCEDVTCEDVSTSNNRTTKTNDSITIVKPGKRANPLRTRPGISLEAYVNIAEKVMNSINNFFNNPDSIMLDYSTVDLTNTSSSSIEDYVTKNREVRSDQNLPTSSNRSEQINAVSAPRNLYTPSATSAVQSTQSVCRPDPPANETPGRRIGDCPICMDSLANNPIASTLCGHIFCLNCIKAAIRANGKRCPTCRKTLKGKEGYHQLYL